MLSLLVTLLLAAAPSHAQIDRGDDCDLALASFRQDFPDLPAAALNGLNWYSVNDGLVARPVDPDLTERVSLRVAKSGMTRAWTAALTVAPRGFDEWNAVSYAFEAMQKQRHFRVGFTDEPRAGEVPRGLRAIFDDDSPPDEADVEDGFEVLGLVLAALRGQGPRPRLH